MRTVRDPLVDGLYADGGAEHITQPGYELFWQHAKEFNLPVIHCHQRDDVVRFIEGKPYTDEMLRDRKVLKGFGFNQREVDFLTRNPWGELGMLFYGPYLDNFEDEYRPFEAKLNHLDQMTGTDLIKKEKASPAALRFAGGPTSALHALWHAAILKLRGNALYPTKVFRLKGGNQRITDAFARRLGNRLRLGSAATRIEHSETGVQVRYREGDQERSIEADYLVCCINLRMLQKLSVTPDWPAAKRYAISNLPYYSNTRVIFQSRTRFWETDGISPNMAFGEPTLSAIWQMASEVDTGRGLLEGTASGVTSAEEALATYRQLYPGKSENIEQAQVVNWPKEPWAASCETVSYQPGELPRIWPEIIRPHGRIHFAGAYADNLNWGMEAATRSAHRVAEAIDKA